MSQANHGYYGKELSLSHNLETCFELSVTLILSSYHCRLLLRLYSWFFTLIGLSLPEALLLLFPLETRAREGT